MKYRLWTAASAGIMLLLPWAAVTFVKGDGGMAACFALFFAVDPIYSVLIGILAGRDMEHLWSLPILSAFLFLAGTWLFFGMGEPAFLIYAAVYLVLGGTAMLISGIVCRVVRR